MKLLSLLGVAFASLSSSLSGGLSPKKTLNASDYNYYLDKTTLNSSPSQFSYISGNLSSSKLSWFYQYTAPTFVDGRNFISACTLFDDTGVSFSNTYIAGNGTLGGDYIISRKIFDDFISQHPTFYCGYIDLFCYYGNDLSAFFSYWLRYLIVGNLAIGSEFSMSGWNTMPDKYIQLVDMGLTPFYLKYNEVDNLNTYVATNAYLHKNRIGIGNGSGLTSYGEVERFTNINESLGLGQPSYINGAEGIFVIPQPYLYVIDYPSNVNTTPPYYFIDSGYIRYCPYGNDFMTEIFNFNSTYHHSTQSSIFELFVCDYAREGNALSDSYNTGYNDGYNAGYNTGYGVGGSNGYTTGLSEGEDIGYENGYEDGYNVGYSAGHTSTDYSFMDLFGAIADTPILMIRSLFNFDVFGMNLLVVVMSLFTAVILFYLLRKLL